MNMKTEVIHIVLYLFNHCHYCLICGIIASQGSNNLMKEVKVVIINSQKIESNCSNSLIRFGCSMRRINRSKNRFFQFWRCSKRPYLL